MSASPFRFWCGLGLSAVAVSAADLDREIVLAPHRGETIEDRAIIRWQEHARTTTAGSDAGAFERLARAYVAKARVSLDAGFYKLAEKTLDVMDAKAGMTAESRLLRGHVLHNLHRFKDAETIARRLADERGEPRDFALLSDALIEQGKLADGAAALQRLVEMKPGVEAFSRIAHLRWLKGDSAGAMTAMRRAFEASDPRAVETRAWLLTRLSWLHLQAGEMRAALGAAEAAEKAVQNYAPALLARGRALAAGGNFVGAVAALRRAERLQPLPEYQWWLSDVLAAAGERDEAADVESRLKKRGAETDPRTLALFLATRGENRTEAVRLARGELEARSDVFSHDALAWALLASGEAEPAWAEIKAALATGTKDARLLLHAGEIARARGESEAARRFFAEALAGAGTLTPSERERLAHHDRAHPDTALR